MASIRIGLMGRGRIGRDLLRILLPLEDIRIAAVSDPAEDRALEYLLRWDTILGRFPGALSIRDSRLHVQGRTIPVLHRAQDEQWGDLGEHVSKTVSWFDNSWGYSQRMVDLIGLATGS